MAELARQPFKVFAPIPPDVRRIIQEALFPEHGREKIQDLPLSRDALIEVLDHVTKKRMVLVRAECGLGCRCVLALVRVHKEVQ